MSTKQAAQEYVVLSGDTLTCSGQWTLGNARMIRAKSQSFLASAKDIVEIDAGGIEKLDSAGAVLLEQMILEILEVYPQLNVTGLGRRYEALMEIIASKNSSIYQSLPESLVPNWFSRVGYWAKQKFAQLLTAFGFFGEFFYVCFLVIKRPRLLSFNSILSLIYQEGALALPIVALMSFLIGIVLAYQMGVQLKAYNANIFIVQFSGIAILREFSPLITAIIMAGRTSTAFASMIGSMKVNEEISALSTMGRNIIATLVLPRGIALFVSLPLLVVWSSLFSILGSMVMSKHILSISYTVFVQNFSYTVGVKQYILGMVKVPFFALVVAVVGCFQGIVSGMSAQSVGKQTTKAAVQAIFLIIVTDSIFSILYSVLGI